MVKLREPDEMIPAEDLDGIVERLTKAINNRIIAVLIAAVVGGNGVQLATTARKDPFTGTQGTEMEQRINAHLERIRADASALRARVDTGTERISALESEIRFCSALHRQSKARKKTGEDRATSHPPEPFSTAGSARMPPGQAM